MQSVEIRGLEELDKRLDALLKELPEAKRRLHEELAAMIKKEADIQFTFSAQDDCGKIGGWQTEHVGSMGGYAEVTGETEVPFADGGHYYREARKIVIAKAIGIAEKFSDELAEKIKG